MRELELQHRDSRAAEARGPWEIKTRWLSPAAMTGLIALLLVVMLWGCQSQPQPVPRAQSLPTDSTPIETPTGRPLTPDEAVLSDPCAIQLHDISGALLMYYALHRRLPDQLDQITPLADIDTPLNFKCPVSHLEYLYSPTGLIAPGKSKRIIVYDAAPAHHGNRWCIVMAMQSREGAAQSMDVISVPEAVFRTYLPTGN